jgi:hypothetical protein
MTRQSETDKQPTPLELAHTFDLDFAEPDVNECSAIECDCDELAISKLRDEQRSAATLLLAGHPRKRGLELAIADCMAEELAILRAHDIFCAGCGHNLGWCSVSIAGGKWCSVACYIAHNNFSKEK